MYYTEASTDATSLPRTLGELQLYRVLQRANLLSYYDTFIQQGGDDVQQLCEAGEDEFLEIMSLVGMATKPLHVRRLQKALRDWATNPGLFNQPCLSSVPINNSIPLFKISETVGRGVRLSNGHPNQSDTQNNRPGNVGNPEQREQCGKRSPQLDRKTWTAQISPETDDGDEEDIDDEEDGRGALYGPPGKRLEAEMVQVISESVERLMKGLPRGDLSEAHSMLKLNKKWGRSLGHIFNMSDGDQRKEREIRRHSVIYGRCESKRREGKRLTIHELTVNEAAAQCCMKDNTLLLRRVELCSLARQVARESSYLASLKCSRLNVDEIGVLQANLLKQEAVELPLQSESESGTTPARPTLEEDSSSMSGESVDGHLQAIAVRIASSPGAPPTDLSVTLPHSSPWSRQLIQQTLIDEGLRLARLVSRDRLGRLSLCVPSTAHISECEDGGSESCPSLPVSPHITELRPGNCKGQDENKN
ncbi:NGFI-A-binding protein 2 [Bombina bombina]|uniref:NGFI-A-binding protein 2 n=1 Tax=Bombina bombina TaxID=8345 RepID=UPI00235A5F76|nr:NGFI-A-binding protein 2 [Bombina bombina]